MTRQAEASTSRIVRNDKKDCEFAMTGSFPVFDCAPPFRGAMTESIGRFLPPVDYLAGNWFEISDCANLSK
jgi:hypothetical protein